MAQVLVIDGDDTLRETFHLLLEDDGHTVTTIASPADALDLLRTSPDCLVVLFDTGVPRLSNGQITALASMDDPILRRHAYICTTTGEAFMHPDLRAVLIMLAVPIIEKPFAIDDLLMAVNQAEERISLQTRQHNP